MSRAARSRMNTVDRWRRLIEKNYECAATYVESSQVDERFSARSLWRGEVGVFELSGHPLASRAYMLVSADACFTVLHAGLVDSPEAAVRAVVAHAFHRRDVD